MKNFIIGKDKTFLFVYGTLMKNYRQGQTYLDGQEFMGESTLEGYSLYDLGSYPGIIEDQEGKVKGELYSVSTDKFPEMDIYEKEGTIYKRELVKVFNENHELLEAYTYVYNQPISYETKIDYMFLPWFVGLDKTIKNYVWYACYGSNINTCLLYTSPSPRD